MPFENISEFIAMGGHGLYVWLSYAIAAVVIGYNLISPRMAKKQLYKEHQRKLRREQS
ncbi:heme exporter protein CcmD [Reinekea marinisedimentorum]|uniref:Heme exporter protein D n=1 Tax=Reinekea marinisedimentorum TaxID=230495 RepID=A0A4R3IAL3_9GAMM|nr:heme exporter protein CcmD [Reinekea marinisedimentorum]TCS41420.1 heme exporter protein D [Reinekea marinisedimentorum]